MEDLLRLSKSREVAKLRLTADFAEILNIEFIRRGNYLAVAEALVHVFIFARGICDLS